MIIPDTSLLLYAYGSDHLNYAKSKSWWAGCLAGTEPVGLCHLTIFAFVRVATNPRLFAKPLSVGAATRHVESWLDQPVVQYLESTAEDIGKTLQLLEEIGTAGNLTTDAQIAAVAIRHNAVIHTADSDFSRFRGVRWHNPLAPLKPR